jgi:AcrR family transcriptional regulator
VVDAKGAILQAVRVIVLGEGYAALSTRKVAEAAGVPLSQIHYHFGSKEQLVLAALAAENARLLERHAALYAGDEPFSVQWARACDYLDADLASGYVRMLQEMIAAGWAKPLVNRVIQAMGQGWHDVLTGAFARAEASGVSLAPLTVAQAVALTAAAFIGAESMLLSGMESPSVPLREALCAIGQLFAVAQTQAEEPTP